MISLRRRFGLYLCLLFLASVAWCAELPAPSGVARARADPVVARDLAQAPGAGAPSGEGTPAGVCPAGPATDPIYAFLAGQVAGQRGEQGREERARELLQQLRDQWPESALMIYLIEGSTLAELDRLQAAMEVYDKALAAFPGDHELLYARGLHALSLNRLDIMEGDFRAILAEDPDNADTLNALGYSLVEYTERFTEALSYIERALTLKPDDPAILDSMGWVQFRLGNSERALDYLRRALAPMPNGEIAAHLGEVLWTLGWREKACSTWEEALEQEPNHEYLLRVIGRYKAVPAAPGSQ